MKPSCLSLPLLLALVPGLARAQGAFPTNAHATVTSAVSVAKLADLSFGATPIVAGAAATVLPQNGGAARVDYNEPTSVTAPAFLMLSGPSGSQLRIDLTCAQAAAASAPAPAAFTGGCAGGFTPPLSGNIGGSHYLYFGGVIGSAATNAAAAGTYAGSFAVTATYVAY